MQTDTFRFYAMEFPFPIAYWFRRALDRDDSTEDIQHLFVSTIEFAGIVLVGDYLASEKRDPEVDRHLLEILDSPATLGEWRKFIIHCLEHRQRARAPVFLKELDELLDRSAQKEMQSLIEWRNEWVHTWPDSDRRRFRATLFSLLQRVHLIHRSTLFSPRTARLNGDLHGYRSIILKGDNPNFSEATLEASEPVETEKVYLASAASGWILPLHPFLTFSRCDTCGEMHYFHLRKAGGKKLTHASLPGGHIKSSGQDLVSLESLLKVPKDRIIRPRYLGIPGMFAAFSRTLRPGDLLGPYRIEALIKLGGMAQIYRATDTRSGASHALKVLPIERARDPALLMRFESEATNLKRLDHPSVVKIHDAGKYLGDHFMVLGLAGGRQAGGKLHMDVSDVPKPCPEAEILDIAKHVCAALDYIHAQSFVHRDLKPGNLLLDGDRVILTDFGIARPTDRPAFTLVGLPAGTPEYMAPEQAQQGEIDGRTDLYALGCVLYELATGQPPYKAESPMGVLYAHLHSSPPEIEALNPAISTGLIHIVKRLLQKDPERRYQAARNLYDHLVRVDQDPAGPQIIEGNKRPEDLRREAAAIERERARYRRRLAAWVGALAVAGALVILLVVLGPSLQAGREVMHARARLEADPLATAEACRHIEQAMIASPDHSGLSRLLDDIRRRGALRIRTDPPGRKVDVAADPGASPKADPGRFAPEILEGSGERKDWFFLAPGHYRVTVEGLATPIPVLIGHDLFEEQPDRSWRFRGLLPHEGAGRRSARGSLVFARVLDLPISIPAGAPLESLRYIPPGPHYISRHEGAESTVIPHEAARDLDSRFPAARQSDAREFPEPEKDIQLATEGGFWIGTREVTVGEFLPWLRKHWKDLVEWLSGTPARILINDFTRSIPLDLLYARYGGAPADASARSLEHFLEGFRCAGMFRAWEQYGSGLSDYLESKAEMPRLPVVNVRMVVALAYAQTHAPLTARELGDWLRSKIRESDEVEGKLGDLLAWVGRRPEGLIPAAEVPDCFRLWLAGDRLASLRERGNPALGYRTAFDAYRRWLTYESGFAAEMPLEAMADHGRRHAAELRLTESDVDAAIARLAGAPETFVEKDEQALLIRNDYWSALWKGPAGVSVEKKHFARWLEGKIREAAGEAASLRALEERVSRLVHPDAEVPDSVEVPWAVRLEYGYDAGWSLPTPGMFEKALRGADARPYPWGVDRSVKASLNGVYGELQSVDHYGRGGDEDVSPWGVMGLAGNVSEWVLVPERSDWLDHAKGGCHWLALDRAVAGRQVGLALFGHRPWIGFRVVREQLPAGKYRRHVR